VAVDDTSEKFIQKIINLVRMRTGLECDVRRSNADSINDILMEADKAGVLFAFVVWPRNVEADTCALNFLRMSFMADSVGFDEQKVDQAVELVHNENTRLRQMLYGAQYFVQPQQQMMYAAQQQPAPGTAAPAPMMPVLQQPPPMPASAPGPVPQPATATSLP